MQMARRAAHKQKKRAEQNEIERDVSRKAPVFAGVTETAARDIEAANLRGDCGDDEDRGKRGQDRQSSEIKTARDERESAQNFQPGKIKCEPHADRPRQDFVIIDVARESDWIERFDCAGINENTANDKFRDPPDEPRNS